MLPEPSTTSKNRHASASHFDAEFGEAWAIYPYKKGSRKAALRAYSARRRAGASAEELLTATRNYAAAMSGTEERYVLNGSTFFGPDDHWHGYLVPANHHGVLEGPPRVLEVPAR